MTESSLAIAQLFVDCSVLNIDVAAITALQTGNLALALQGVVTPMGIFAVATRLCNLSLFALDLSTVNFALAYGSIALGVGTGTDTRIAPGNNSITLSGTLVPQYGAQNLSEIGQLFTNYINGDNPAVLAMRLSTTQADGTQISWLSIALQALHQHRRAWPGFHTRDRVVARNELGQRGSAAAALPTPVGASTSSIDVVNATCTHGNTQIDTSGGEPTTPDAAHAMLPAPSEARHFIAAETVVFQLIGNSSAQANRSVGVITLDSIKVNVSMSLFGLRGLTVISSGDVGGGTPSAITLDIGTDIYNSSSLVLATGDLMLELFRSASNIGTALLAQGNCASRRWARSTRTAASSACWTTLSAGRGADDRGLRRRHAGREPAAGVQDIEHQRDAAGRRHETSTRGGGEFVGDTWSFRHRLVH
ncbi:hypothetical protein HWV62_20870 [Athelia sp. TMB]|nr:hypothetical protein HWV62_20870 [Athelia sp. TMB]